MDPLFKLSITCPYISKVTRLPPPSSSMDHALRTYTMVSKTCVGALVCVGVLLALRPPLPAAAGVAELTVEARRTRTRTGLRRDYAPRGLAADELADEYGPPYERGAGPLPDLVLDYADINRNDIILLDNSIETRTRKRNNIKVKKHSNQAISNVPCNCERIVVDDKANWVNLSEAWSTRLVYPELVRNITCDQTKCAKPYQCQKIIYNVTVLRNTRDASLYAGVPLYDAMHNELKRKWVPRVVPVVAGCLCTARFLDD